MRWSQEARSRHKPSIVARDRTVMRGLPVRQIEQDFIDIAPAPSLRRIVALDDGMTGGVEMLGSVLIGRIVTTADVAAGPADPQMQPHAAALEALFAAKRARRDIADAGDMGAALGHQSSPALACWGAACPRSSGFRRVKTANKTLRNGLQSIGKEAVQRRHHLRAFADR